MYTEEHSLWKSLLSNNTENLIKQGNNLKRIHPLVTKGFSNLNSSDILKHCEYCVCRQSSFLNTKRQKGNLCLDGFTGEVE